MGAARDYLISVVDDIHDAWVSAQGDRDATRDEVAGWFDSVAGHLQKWALSAAMEKMGLQIDASNGVNDKSITNAINAGPLAGSGVVLESVLDRDKLMRGLEALALSRACVAFGLPGAGTVAGLRDGVREWLAAELVTQIASEAGALVDGAPDRVSLLNIIAKGAVTVGWNEPQDMTAAGVSNRARQVAYRAKHKRKWVEK